ncbi:type II toxin-antitoxin system RelE/ParE family toxin [Serratia fonticola]|jgi:plasmid stabilization system protein ParE
MNFMWSSVARSDLIRLYEHMKQSDENQAKKSISVLKASPWSFMPGFGSECRVTGFSPRDIRKAEVGGFKITYEVRKDSLVVLLVELKHYYLFNKKNNQFEI